MRKVICMVGIWGAFLWIVYLQQDIFWRGHKLPPTIPWATVLHARTQRVKRICQKYNLTQANKQVSSKRLRILCFPSLKRLTNRTIDPLDSNWIRHMHRDMRHGYAINPLKIGDKSMKDYAFFTVVRHPLERIVSTYRDKIMAWDHYRHWRDIVGYNPAQPFKGFQQFVKILTDTTDLERNTRLAGQRGRANVHLEYFWRRCDLCHIHFDVVAKLETFQLDSQYILQNRLPAQLGDQQAVSFNESFHASPGESTSRLTKSLMAQLPPPLRQKLRQMYQIDLEMFDYL